MERYFILDKYNTWYDWRLYLTSKSIPDPEPNTNYVKLDGMSGTLDLSESLTGEITYADRTISATFWTDSGSFKERELLLRRIIATLHGKKIKIIEPDDPNHYFFGRVKIKSKKNILPYLEFTIEATCEPWRYDLEDTVRTISVSSSTATNVAFSNNGVKTLCPIITITGSVTLIYKGVEIPLTEGDYKIVDIKLRQGVTVIGVSGNGSATFTYKEADL